MLTTDSGQELQNKFCGFCLSCTTLATDDHTLISLSPFHEVVSIVRCGEDVRGFFADLFVFVSVDVCLVVDGKELVGIDCNQDRSCQGLKRGRGIGVIVAAANALVSVISHRSSCFGIS